MFVYRRPPDLRQRLQQSPKIQEHVAIALKDGTIKPGHEEQLRNGSTSSSAVSRSLRSKRRKPQDKLLRSIQVLTDPQCRRCLTIKIGNDLFQLRSALGKLVPVIRREVYHGSNDEERCYYARVEVRD